MRRAFGVSTNGVDMTAESIAWAEANLPDGKHCVGDASNLSFVPDNSYDLVFSWGVIHHLPPILQCQSVQEMVRIAKPGGHIYSGFNGYVFIKGYGMKWKGYAEENKKFWEECFAGTGEKVEVAMEASYLKATHSLLAGDPTGSHAVVIRKSQLPTSPPAPPSPPPPPPLPSFPFQKTPP